MFYEASSFNGDISIWDVSSVRTIDSSACLAPAPFPPVGAAITQRQCSVEAAGGCSLMLCFCSLTLSSIWRCIQLQRGHQQLGCVKCDNHEKQCVSFPYSLSTRGHLHHPKPRPLADSRWLLTDAVLRLPRPEQCSTVRGASTSRWMAGSCPKLPLHRTVSAMFIVPAPIMSRSPVSICVPCI